MKPKIAKSDIIQNLLKTELKDIPIEILNHSDSSFIGIEGVIIGETKNMLIVKVNGKEKMISKADGEFGILFKGTNLKILGNILLGTMKQRSKRKHKGW